MMIQMIQKKRQPRLTLSFAWIRTILKILTANSLATVSSSALYSHSECLFEVLAGVLSEVACGHHALGVDELLDLGSNYVAHRIGGNG